MATIKKYQTGGPVKTTKKPKTVSQRIGDITLRDVKNAGEDALNLSTLGGYAKAKRALGGKYRGKKNGGNINKAKNGKSFPDLNKDGKITKADILKGRGVIAQTGKTVKTVKKTKTSKQSMNTIVPGMGIPTTAPKKIETMNAKVGKSVKKYQMGGFVSNEFAAKSFVKAKPKPKPKFIDSPIKTTRGKDINAYQGKKGMLAKSGKSIKKCKYGCK